MRDFDDNVGSHVVLKKREPQKIDNLLELCLRQLRLDAGLNDLRIYRAWDTVSGAAEYTVDKYFSKGTLFCRITSSVVRSMLVLRREELLRRLNEALKDESDIISGRGQRLEVKRLVLR